MSNEQLSNNFDVGFNLRYILYVQTTCMHKYFDIFNHGFLSLFVDEIVDVDGFALIFSSANDGMYWNAANKINFPETEITETVIDIELLFSNKNRKPVFWISPDDHPDNMEYIIRDKGYSHKAVDSWMIQRDPKHVIPAPSSLYIQEVQNVQQMEDFIKVFGMNWDDSAGTYASVIRKKAFDPIFSQTSKLLVGYEGNTPVAITGYVISENVAMVHSVATIKDKRRHGYASIMSQQAVSKSHADEVIVKVDAYSEAKTLYSKLGFEDLAQIKIYCK